VAEVLGTGVAYGDVRVANVCFCRQLPGGEFPVHGPKVDKDNEEPRHTEGWDRQWKQQVEITGVCKRRKGRKNIRRQCDKEIHGRERAIESLLRHSEAL
jgi:hypothetical protein